MSSIVEQIRAAVDDACSTLAELSRACSVLEDDIVEVQNALDRATGGSEDTELAHAQACLFDAANTVEDTHSSLYGLQSRLWRFRDSF